MDKDTEELINALILFYWIGLQPYQKIDALIEKYLRETNQTSNTLVKNVNKAEKNSNIIMKEKI
jgi:hypothetical protein